MYSLQTQIMKCIHFGQEFLNWMNIFCFGSEHCVFCLLLTDVTIKLDTFKTEMINESVCSIHRSLLRLQLSDNILVIKVQFKHRHITSVPLFETMHFCREKHIYLVRCSLPAISCQLCTHDLQTHAEISVSYCSDEIFFSYSVIRVKHMLGILSILQNMRFLRK